MSPLLEADCVGKRYGDHAVLTCASLRAIAGAVTALVGRNGAGKSTLLRIVTGAIAPDTGFVRLRGQTLMTTSLARLAHAGVFFLPDRDLLHPALNLGVQLRAVAEAFGSLGDHEAIANQLAIEHVLAQKPGALSGGERRRAEIAAAIARRPSILIADEPLRGITPLDTELVLAALATFARAGGAVVLTGHETTMLLPAADRITWCTAGTTREFASTHAAMSDFAFRRDFLP